MSHTPKTISFVDTRIELRRIAGLPDKAQRMAGIEMCFDRVTDALVALKDELQQAVDLQRGDATLWILPGLERIAAKLTAILTGGEEGQC